MNLFGSLEESRITDLMTSKTQKILREFYGTECSTVMHGTAFQATDAPVISYKNNKIG